MVKDGIRSGVWWQNGGSQVAVNWMLSATGHAITASVHFPRTQIEVDSIGVDFIKVDSIEMDSIEMGIRCCMLLDRPKHSINSQPSSQRTGAVCVRGTLEERTNLV